MTTLKSAIEAIFKSVCHQNQLTFEAKWFEHFPASDNDSVCNQHILNAAKANNFTIQERVHPFKFGEDFGWFSKEYKTAMFGLGAGYDVAALHNANYDFPDEIIETGIEMFKEIITNIMQQK